MLAAVIDALTDCAQACTADVSADLSEPQLAEMVTCIRLCLDCADICAASAGVVSRQAAYDPGVVRPLLEACAASCRSCGDECEHHAAHHAALPGLRRGVPALRAGLLGPAGRAALSGSALDGSA